jgi:hypothetical protein
MLLTSGADKSAATGEQTRLPLALMISVTDKKPTLRVSIRAVACFEPDVVHLKPLRMES